jgi:hypothetical protein
LGRIQVLSGTWLNPEAHDPALSDMGGQQDFADEGAGMTYYAILWWPLWWPVLVPVWGC